MSDDTDDSNVVHLPPRGGDSGGMPDAPDGGDLFYSEPSRSGADSGVPPESPAETTMELPRIRGPISPETALRETGMPSAPDSGDGEYEEGEHVQPRSLADRLGDWLELRIEMARDRRAEEAPFREAEIARKVALLEARTAQETAMMEQNAKLHTAQMKAKADKGGRSKTGGGGGSRGGGTNSGGSGRGGTGGGRGSGTNGSGGTGHGSGGGNSPKGTGKGSDRSAGGRGGGSKGKESSDGSKGRQNGSGGSGSGKSGTSTGSSGGTGRNGSGSSGSGKGGSKGDGGKAHNSPASSPASERARGRQERAATRQAGRQERRTTGHAAGIADRTKDRDQARANRQKDWEDRRAKKAEREEARKAKREAAASADPGRTTLGAAIAEEAQRRWDKRRADAEADTSDPEKVSLSKDKGTDGEGTDGKGDKTAEEGPDGASSAGKDNPAPDEPDKGSKAGDEPSGGSKKRRSTRRRRTGKSRTRRKDRTRRKGQTGRKSRTRRTGRGRHRGRSSDSPFGPDDSVPTMEWPDHPTRPPRPADGVEDDIEDAVIVDDVDGRPMSGPQPVTTGVRGLPPAPEPHTERPGTTRHTAQEDPVTSKANKPASGQAGMAAQHRTDITFGEYLMEVVNIALAAGLDKDRAQDLAVALGKVADALRDMAADLVGDHNIATEVVDQITDLADAAMRMKQLAERCATECEIASEAARLAAVAVGRTYGEDIQAMDEAGLTHASAAVHHD
ncbi:ATP/GTP-binding protein [Streptomyces sp. RKCA744]|uniref:ATP/GTP-binding protein n=1 Tax=Streptomyces sp. RKCA744 TaxID=2959340 RepID=UPI00209F3718|nr:ATP/GTP-binding protein [Streptomyces sp. RKCA744]MCO8303598.1 ATP/GTP-binding protein [Streptomyces sp. RKCA744]